MVSKEDILEIFNRTMDINTSDFEEKCKPGYVSPQQRLEKFDETKFNEEDWGEDTTHIIEDAEDMGVEEIPIGRLEQKQFDLQEKVNYTDEEEGMISTYNSPDLDVFNKLNSYLNEVPYKSQKYRSGGVSSPEMLDGDTQIEVYTDKGQEFTDDMSLEDFSDKLSKIIKKSPSLQENSVLWRSGHFDKNLKVGESGTFNGFSSTTFNESFAYAWQENFGTENSYVMKIYAPKGTNGVATEFAEDAHFESEFLLDKKQKYVIISKDDNLNPPVVELLLY